MLCLWYQKSAKRQPYLRVNLEPCLPMRLLLSLSHLLMLSHRFISSRQSSSKLTLNLATGPCPLHTQYSYPLQPPTTALIHSN